MKHRNTLLGARYSSCLPFSHCCFGIGTAKMSFSIVTGGTGGVWYPLGGAIGSVITQKVPGVEATAEATTAAIDNLKLLGANRAGLAWAYDYHVVWANEGKIEALRKNSPCASSWDSTNNHFTLSPKGNWY